MASLLICGINKCIGCRAERRAKSLVSSLPASPQEIGDFVDTVAIMLTSRYLSAFRRLSGGEALLTQPIEETLVLSHQISALAKYSWRTMKAAWEAWIQKPTAERPSLAWSLILAPTYLKNVSNVTVRKPRFSAQSFWQGCDLMVRGEKSYQAYHVDGVAVDAQGKALLGYRSAYSCEVAALDAQRDFSTESVMEAQRGAASRAASLAAEQPLSPSSREQMGNNEADLEETDNPLGGGVFLEEVREERGSGAENSGPEEEREAPHPEENIPLLATAIQEETHPPLDEEEEMLKLSLEFIQSLNKKADEASRRKCVML